MVSTSDPWLSALPQRVDVVAIDCGAALSREHADFFREIAETHKALTTDLLISKESFKEAAIGIGTQITSLGIQA